MKGSKFFIKLAAAIFIILIAVGIVYTLYANKPVTKKRRPSPVVPIVEAVTIAPGIENIYLRASGTVIPGGEALITNEVEGKIIFLHNEMVPGGIVRKDETLIKIDPKEYVLQVKERKAAVAAALSKLDIEKGRQVIADEEWRIFEKEQPSGESDNSLALREPHLRSAQAELESEVSRLDMAKLALKKTEIIAPFNGVIVEESAEIGQFVGRQTKMATLVGTDFFRIQASIAPAYIKRISFPEKGGKGSKVRIITESSGGERTVRTGLVERVLPDLDPKGRMARILISINDPLNLNGRKGMGKLLLGSFVEVEIEAGKIENVYIVPRESIIDEERILILKEDWTLDIRKAVVKWRRKNELLISTDIADGERLIVTAIRNPLPGMKLRVSGEKGKRSASPKSARK